MPFHDTCKLLDVDKLLQSAGSTIAPAGQLRHCDVVSLTSEDRRDGEKKASPTCIAFISKAFGECLGIRIKKLQYSYRT